MNQLGTMTVNRLHNTPGAIVILAGGINDCTFKKSLIRKFLFTLIKVSDMSEHMMGHIENIDWLILDVPFEARVVTGGLLFLCKDHSTQKL